MIKIQIFPHPQPDYSIYTVYLQGEEYDETDDWASLGRGMLQSAVTLPKPTCCVVRSE